MTMAVLTDEKTREIQLGKIIAKAWVDAEFREQLINYPSATLKEVGIFFEDVVEVRVGEGESVDGGFSAVADGKMIYELTLPAKPDYLTDEEIKSWFEGVGSEDRPVPTSTT